MCCRREGAWQNWNVAPSSQVGYEMFFFQPFRLDTYYQLKVTLFFDSDPKRVDKVL